MPPSFFSVPLCLRGESSGISGYSRMRLPWDTESVCKVECMGLNEAAYGMV